MLQKHKINNKMVGFYDKRAVKLNCLRNYKSSLLTRWLKNSLKLENKHFLGNNNTRNSNNAIWEQWNQI